MRRYDFAKFGVLLLLGAAAIVVITAYSIQERFARLPLVVVASPVPTFTAVASVARPLLLSPLTGSPVTAGVVDLHGSAQPGYIVQALVDGAEVGRATADSDGIWALSSQLETAGERTVRLRLIDPQGAMVGEAAPLTLTVTLPAVTIPAPALDPQVLAANLTPGLIQLSGTGEAGTAVQVVVDDRVIGTAPVGAGGRWSFAAEVRLPGVYALRLNTVDAAGTVVATATPVLLAIAPPAEAVAAVPPTATATLAPPTPTPIPAPTATTAPSATATPSETPVPTATPLPSATPTTTATPIPSATATPLPTATATVAPPAISALNLVPAVAGASLSVSGSGLPQTQVMLRIDAQPVATATTGIDGAWTITTTLPGAGEYAIDVAALDGRGAAAAVTMPLRLQVAATATPEPTATDSATATPLPTDTTTVTPSAKEETASDTPSAIPTATIRQSPPLPRCRR